jgi:hypothetical protein
MLQKFPFLGRFFSKLVYELLPAAVASVIGGLIIGHYARPSVTTPAVVVDAPASAAMMQMVRDEHDLIVNYLKKANETRQKTDLAAEQEMVRSKAAEQAAILAADEAIAAESKARAIAADVAVKPERKIVMRPPVRRAEKIAAAAPLPLHSATSASTPIQPAGQPSAVPARAEAPAPQGDGNIITAKFHEVAALVERIPVWARSAAEWLTPRPLTPSPDQNILKVSL